MGELGQPRRQIRAGLDIVALLWISVAFFEFVYLTGYVDINLVLAVKGLIGAAFLIGGLFLSSIPAFGVGVVLDVFIDQRDFFNWISGVFICFVTIFIMNAVVKQYANLTFEALTVAPITVEIFVMLIGISEECALRGWFLNFLSNLTGSDEIAIFVSSAIGATLHAGIYGARHPVVIGVVFLCFAVIGFFYATSTEMIKGPFLAVAVPARRLSMVMTGHALVNLLAVFKVRRTG